MHAEGAARAPQVETRRRQGAWDVPDQLLLARMAVGDRAPVAALYDRYSCVAYSLALQLVRDPAQAEDIVQDTFLTVWRRAADYDERRGTVRAWLLSIVHHRAVDVLRSARHRREGNDADAVLLELPASSHVEHEAERREEARMVRQALGVLPRDQRLAIDLAFFGGYSYPQIAQFLGLPVGTVKSRMRLALNKLRIAVAPCSAV